MSLSLPPPVEVLAFWFGEPGLQIDWPAQSRHALWFGGGHELDAQVTARFGPLVNAALAGELAQWEADVHTRMALILLLDQLARNVHRGTARAFAGDERAQRLVLQTLALSEDNGLPRVGRVFLYMPLMHAENIDLQRECLTRLETLAQHSPPTVAQQLQGNLQAAQQHMDIIERFGRFPHRNAALGRSNTAEEEAFLKDGPRFGQ